MDAKKKFRYTKQLISMALRDGWTQQDIAHACRTQQSVVSAWKSGSKQALESQLKPLLDLYGSRLRRKTAKIYHAVFKEQDAYQIRMIKVEGEVVLTFPYRGKEFCPKCEVLSSNCRCHSKTKVIRHTKRLVVHAMGRGEYCAVRQSRLINDESQHLFVESNVYNSVVLGRFSAQEILETVDSMGAAEGEHQELNEVELFMARMLVRKALLENGQPLDGVEEYLAAW